MNTKPYLCALCVIWTPTAVLAANPTSPRTQAQPPAKTAISAKASSPSHSDEDAAPAPPAAKPQKVAAKPTSTVRQASATHAAAQPGHGYHYGPEFTHDPGFAYGHDYGCEDGYCHDGDFYDGWFCSPRLKHWGSAEYLLWWRKGMRIPPLVSTGPTPPGAVLFGNGIFDFGPQSGGRVAAGVWLDDYECIGLGGRFFGLSDGRIDFQQAAVGGGALARPFIDADTGAPNAVNIAGPLGGAVSIGVESEVFGADAFFRRRIECGFCGRLDVLAGYCYSQINEEIDIRTTTTLPPGPPAALNVFDTFDTENEFHGGTLGLQAEFDRGLFTVGVLGKIAFGNMRETVTIAGGNNNPAAAAGLQGLLAQNTNIGVFEQDEFAVVPEINLNLGYRVTENFEVSMGYSMIYWSHVVQPGDQIDLTVDVTPAAGTTRPQFAFDSTDYWVMGMNFGVQWSY